MIHTQLIKYAIVLGAISTLLSCGDKTASAEKAAPEALRSDTHTVVLGGDFILGKRFNKIVHRQTKLKSLFHDVLPILQNADLAIVNAEGVVAQSGSQVNKYMLQPIYYHTHPDALLALTNAGIDMVTVGNNHAGDYGPQAFTEMLHHLGAAGIDYFGGGINREDAMQPAYRKLGDTVVALVGGEFSGNRSFDATRESPGILLNEGLQFGHHMDEMIARYATILKEARRHAHVVLFSPHWGLNFTPGPTKHIQALAHSLIDAGYDGIFGHSAHQAHGIEMYHGKPIVYDMGNLVIDWRNQPKDGQSFLYEIHVSNAGVESLRAWPLDLDESQTVLATGHKASEAIQQLIARSDDFNTQVNTDGASATLSLQPGSVHSPTEKALPNRPPKSLKGITKGVVLDTLPEDARPLNIDFASGVTLLGYRLLSTEMRPDDGVVIDLFYKARKKVENGPRIHLEARGVLDNGKPGATFAGHIAGDWVFPMEEWPVDKIVRDRTAMRIKLKPEGEVMFFTGLWDGKQMVEDKLIPLEKVRFNKNAPTMGETLDRTP